MRIDWQSTNHWPSRLARYAAGLALFGLGIWVETLYRAGDGPLLALTASFVLVWGAVVVALRPDITAWVRRTPNATKSGDEPRH